MDAHPDAVMPTARHPSSQQRVDAAALNRPEDAAQLRARLLKMIVANEKQRKSSTESWRPR